MNPRFLFTAASQRVLDFASSWTLCNDRNAWSELTPQALLLGLLSESECRAATLLTECGIDPAAVQQHWPSLSKSLKSELVDTRHIPLSQEVQNAFQEVRKKLADLPQPLELATEHILLGLVLANDEVAVWLRTHGLDPGHLCTQIHSMYGSKNLASTISVELEGWGSVKKTSMDEVDRYAGACGVCSGEAASGEDVKSGSEMGSVKESNFKESNLSVLRILDAAENRAREGVRVIEDYARFMLDDLHLTGLCKQLRHDLAAAMAFVPMQCRLAARETQWDVGTGLTTVSESCRENPQNVLAANFARLQEAIRSLEEYGKLVQTDFAAACKQLRYRVYTLQRAVEITQNSIKRLAGIRLYVLISGGDSLEAFRHLAGSLIEAGIHALQLRDKRLDDRRLLERARLLRELTAGTGTLMIVNDRPDLAALSKADGVHVGQEELLVKDARSIVGPDRLVGVSTHSLEQAKQAVLDGADYIGVGPTFPSGTKQFEHFPGIELLRAVAAEIRLPAFAIGGISLKNLSQVTAAGFSRIAVSGAVTASGDPASAVRTLLQALGA